MKELRTWQGQRKAGRETERVELVKVTLRGVWVLFDLVKDIREMMPVLGERTQQRTLRDTGTKSREPGIMKSKGKELF